MVSLQEPTLIVYAKGEKYDELKTHIINSVCSLLKFYDTKKQLNETEVKHRVAFTLEVANEVAELIIDAYTDLPIEALSVFFKKAKMGTYGSPYGELSGGTIMLWFKDFYQEYWQEFYNHKEEENKKLKSDIKNEFIPMPDSTQRVFNNFAGLGFHTDAECKNKRTKEQIRKDIINKNMHLYNEVSVEEADRIIDNEIQVALMAEGIFN